MIIANIPNNRGNIEIMITENSEMILTTHMIITLVEKTHKK